MADPKIEICPGGENKKKNSNTAIKSKMKRNSESCCRVSNYPEMKDTATEAHIETDNVYVTSEIYSATDIPATMQSDKNAQPKPGTVVPEYRDGNCMILRAYRDKKINTEGSYDFSEPCVSLRCIFPPNDFLQKLACYKREIENYPSETCMKINWSMCKDDCPNRLFNQFSQTDVDRSIKQEDQVAVIMKSCASSMMDVKGKHKPGTPKCLTAIDEQQNKCREEFEETENEYEEQDTEEECEDQGTECYQTPSEEKVECLQRPEMKTTGQMTDEECCSHNVGRTSSKDRSLYEMGTMITNQTALWHNKPRKQVCVSRDSFCCDSRMNNHIVRCTKFVEHSMVQCEIIGQNSKSYCPAIDHSMPCQYVSPHNPCLATCFNNLPSTVSCKSNEVCSWTPSRDTFQETMIRRPYCVTNNSRECRESVKNRSSASYHCYSNKAYYNRLGGYCVCNNKYYTPQYTNTYCPMRNQMVYHSPSNCYHFLNTWY